MRRNIKIIAIIITVTIFIVLDFIMFLIDWVFKGSTTIAIISLVIIVGIFLGIVIYLWYRNRQKIKIKY